MYTHTLLFGAYVATAFAACDRTFRNDWTALYLSAQTSDEVLCTSFTEIIVTDPSHPYVIGVRTVGDGKFISKVETLDILPEAERETREVIQAVGDAYFDRFGNINVTVPFGTPCARLEGGAYTNSGRTNGSTCHLGLPSTIHVVNRRYVVDVQYGVVNIYVGFPGLDRASKDPAPDSYTLRVENRKIRYIHTISTCEGHPGCGLNGTYVPLEDGRRNLKGKL
ncbi:hypothetical protein EK21DRAFT_105139 [Setomelanomma holmii]|uniref:DUF8021 domain-containing protein n=1 Tax=Setomelanomma holmii TaxID=210430 RepID=A0A9P4LGL5_9PLEO|nr:hypothetical protein EK21DRAFT_105139 [Setomelanomma holmii]